MSELPVGIYSIRVRFDQGEKMIKRVVKTTD
jgi:hypothetical protein